MPENGNSLAFNHYSNQAQIRRFSNDNPTVFQHFANNRVTASLQLSGGFSTPQMPKKRPKQIGFLLAVDAHWEQFRDRCRYRLLISLTDPEGLEPADQISKAIR